MSVFYRPQLLGLWKVSWIGWSLRLSHSSTRNAPPSNTQKSKVCLNWMMQMMQVKNFFDCLTPWGGLITWSHYSCCSSLTGGKNSIGCTLILTEGDSAKTLAVSGLGVVGRDRYGVFPLRGKMLNVREASLKQVRPNNIAINSLTEQRHFLCSLISSVVWFWSSDHGECWNQQHHQDPWPAVQEKLQWTRIPEDSALWKDHDHDRSGVIPVLVISNSHWSL